MAIPPYIGLSVSILNNNQATYSIPEKELPDARVPETKKPNSLDESLTLMPKKRSFDVAFLISPDDSKQSKSRKTEVKVQPEFDVQTYETTSERIKSAFKKVGIGFSNMEDSRSPSPIDTIRTPSPYKVNFPDKKLNLPPEVSKQKSEFPYGAVGSHRPRFQAYQKELDKSSIFFGNNLISPVSVGLTRQNFIPTPIFGGNPILPTSFVNASLLPPSLAALTLPAQNVCAKCNVSFRMTSDLVYHMRSHHKNDHAGSDHLRRRREMDKLKCPVCNESFRERHHLTRHMTAHQDKEGDNVELESSPRTGRVKSAENSRISGDYDP
ncbi:hypothetical protein RUM44_005747 [Polyplax serrata]|uniref:C2H2-type domain-containing protein n=1 Tax=Polyplax serrata TaxID=468196 RepID=A0ABR1AWE5_POLSC